MSEKTETENTKNPETGTKRTQSEWFARIIKIQLITGFVTIFSITGFCYMVTNLNRNNIGITESLIDRISIESSEHTDKKASFRIKLSDTKEKTLKEYNENQKDFMQAYYEVQSNWLNFWLTILTILLGVLGLVIPLSFMKLYETKAIELEKKMNEDYKNAKITYINDAKEEIDKYTSKFKIEFDEFKNETDKKINSMISPQDYKEKTSKDNITSNKEFLDAQMLFCEALNLQKNKKHEDAIDKYTKAITILKNSEEEKSNLSFAYNNRGNAYSALKEYDKAYEDYEKAINLNGNYFEAYNNYGDVLFKQGKINEAIIYFEKALSIAPLNHVVNANLAEAYLEKKNFSEAEKHLKLAKRYDKKNNLEQTVTIKECEDRLKKAQARE